MDARLRRRQPAARALRGAGRPHHRDAELHARHRHRSGIAPGAAPDRFLHQPRGAAARLRAGDDARRFDQRRLVRDLRPHDLDRRPHAPAGPRACRVLPRREEPDRPEMRPVADAGRPAPADRHPQPGERAGPADADLPLRRRQGRRAPAGADPRGRSAKGARWSGPATRCTATRSRRRAATRRGPST